jgi:hypothetical protein
MLKRLLIVLTCIAGIVFVPWWVGKWIEGNRHIDILVSWWTGFLPLFVMGIICIFLAEAIKWIKTGK